MDKVSLECNLSQSHYQFRIEGLEPVKLDSGPECFVDFSSVYLKHLPFVSAPLCVALIMSSILTHWFGGVKRKMTRC